MTNTLPIDITPSSFFTWTSGTKRKTLLSGYTERKRYEYNIAKLDSILNTTYENGVSFTDNHINYIKLLLLKIGKQPEVFPNGYGEIQLEYEINNKYLEISITAEKNMNIFKIDELGDEYGNDIYLPCDLEKIKKEVAWIYE